VKRNRLRRGLVRRQLKRRRDDLLKIWPGTMRRSRFKTRIPMTTTTPMGGPFAPVPAQRWPGHRKMMGSAVLRPVFFRSALRGGL